ncbi:MAG: ABC-three component system protein [Bacilli bacterium]
MDGLERLGENSESLENKIALCKDCHDEQDYHTTKEDYLKLLNKKKDLMNVLDIGEVLDKMIIQEDIKKIINKLNNLDSSINSELKYDPVKIDKKIKEEFLLLKRKVKNNVTEFYPFIFDEFKKNEVIKNNNSYEVICSEVKAAYLSIKK